MEVDKVFESAINADEYKLYRKLAIFIAFFVPGMTYQYFFLGVNPPELFALINFLLLSFIYSLPFLFLGLLGLLLKELITAQQQKLPNKDYKTFLEENLYNNKTNNRILHELIQQYKQNNFLLELSLSTLIMFGLMWVVNISLLLNNHTSNISPLFWVAYIIVLLIIFTLITYISFGKLGGVLGEAIVKYIKKSKKKKPKSRHK